VFAQLRGNVWTNDCDDFARIVIDFDNGCVGLCEINTTTTRPLPRWHLDGTNGSASAPPSAAFDTRQWARLAFTPADNTAARDLPVAPAGLSESAIWDGFAAACRGAGPPAVEVDSVLVTTRLLDAARQSSAEGKAIDVHGALPGRRE
jgi:predicted dehydrogenase